MFRFRQWSKRKNREFGENLNLSFEINGDYSLSLGKTGEKVSNEEIKVTQNLNFGRFFAHVKTSSWVRNRKNPTYYLKGNWVGMHKPSVDLFMMSSHCNVSLLPDANQNSVVDFSWGKTEVWLISRWKISGRCFGRRLFSVLEIIFFTVRFSLEIWLLRCSTDETECEYTKMKTFLKN